MSKINYLVGFIVVCIYLGIGVYCLTIGSERLNTNPAWFRIFGAVAILYGGFRAYRFYQIYKANQNENSREID
jgi:hypothetical protein